MSTDIEMIGRLPFGQLDKSQLRQLAVSAASGNDAILEVALAQKPPNATVIAAIGSIASLRKAQIAHNGSGYNDEAYRTFDEMERRASEALAVPEDVAVHNRLRHIYLPYLDENPDAQWVMIGDASGDIYGSGTDDQMVDGPAYEQFEQEVGEKVHLFGRPIARG